MSTTSLTTTHLTGKLQRRRRPSATGQGRTVSPGSVPRFACPTLPHSVEALDLTLPSPTATLATLRVIVLSYLADVEHSLSQFESPITELEHSFVDAFSKGELKLEEARAWAQVGLYLLDDIRLDVSSRLPDFHVDPRAIENLVTRLSELTMTDVSSRLPEIPDVRTRIDDVKARLSDLDIPHPLLYIPTLSRHLQELHAHLTAYEFPSGLSSSFIPTHILADLMDHLRSSELIQDVLQTAIVGQAEDRLSRAASEVAAAIKLSLHGSKLITYVDLPEEWKNNPFVTHGYRFIPLNKWHLIALSIFAFHNETLNIHTHLIPFCMWASTMLPSRSAMIPADVPLFIFTFFALLCLFTSTLWHTMAGCAHRNGMVLSAKLDYVGIGWLISASVGTVVYYGFQGHPYCIKTYLGACGLTGLAGSILPFFDWFNTPEHKTTRVAFFVSLAMTAIAPLAHLTSLYSFNVMLAFIQPVLPSLLSYVAGLFFYVSCLPERITPQRWAPYLHYIGGGSHAIWHAFIVLAISQHRDAMPHLARGIGATI